MLRSLKAVQGYKVVATDGEIGKVHDFHFHDDTWIIRYLVVDTGHWLPGRKVLVPPRALCQPNWAGLKFPVALTREQVEKSPDIDTERPVSRQQEADLHSHFGWPAYWMDPGIGPWPAVRPMVPIPAPAEPSDATTEAKADPHLRSVRAVRGYPIHASDGEMGRVEDFIAEDTLWVIRYLVVDTHHWLPGGKQVLISPQWLREISHGQRNVQVSLTQEEIRNCPEFHPGALVNRQYEERLYDYYGRPGYWEEPDPASNAKDSA
jgi:PRC-barrel domain